jgi:hypothetical protein
MKNGLCTIGIRQVTFDRMVMILYRTYNSFSLFAMQLDYCNIPPLGHIILIPSQPVFALSP